MAERRGSVWREGPGRRREMEPQLGLHELLHVFSFLEARDLLCAAQVDKVARSVRGGGRAGRLALLWVWFPIWEAASGGPDAVVGRERSRPPGW